jgi:hypothetical protein
VWLRLDTPCEGSSGWGSVRLWHSSPREGSGRSVCLRDVRRAARAGCRHGSGWVCVGVGGRLGGRLGAASAPPAVRCATACSSLPAAATATACRLRFAQPVQGSVRVSRLLRVYRGMLAPKCMRACCLPRPQCTLIGDAGRGVCCLPQLLWLFRHSFQEKVVRGSSDVCETRRGRKTHCVSVSPFTARLEARHPSPSGCEGGRVVACSACLIVFSLHR